MCYRLSADCLIVNHFFYRQGVKSVSLRELQDEAYAIVSACNNGIIADVSYVDVEEAVLGSAPLFKIEKHKLTLKSPSQLEYLLWKAAIARNLLPQYVRVAMEQVFTQANTGSN